MTSEGVEGSEDNEVEGSEGEGSEGEGNHTFY